MANEDQLIAVLPWVLGSFVVVLFIVWIAQQGRVEKPVTCICPHCWNVGVAAIKMPGSVLVTVLLLLCFALPGIFYALLREGFKRSCCPECGGSPMVPIHSPRGAKLLLESRG